MARGRLEPPNLDDRTWREIVDQARALIPRYAPEWTDHNPSDLGMSLIELFAWLVEGMIYRLNRVPERNQVQFLNLLGLTRTPARPATTWLTYRLDSKAASIDIPQGGQAATPQTEQIEAVVFETDQPLRVLPINLVTALLIEASVYSNVTTDLVTGRLKGVARDIAPSKSVTIALGFDQSSAEKINLHLARSRAAGEDKSKTAWSYSTPNTMPATWVELPSVIDGTNGLHQSGVVTLTVPAGWSSQKPGDWAGLSDQSPSQAKVDRDQALFWIGLRIENPDSQEPLRLELDHVLFNSVPATSALTIARPELLGKSDGKPFQFFELAYRPLFKRPGAPDPYDHLIIRVREPKEGGGFTENIWSRVENFLAGAGHYFRLDPVTGTLHFGNHDATHFPDGHGSIPPPDSDIYADTYRYVIGGARSNLGPRTVTVIRTATLGVVGISNPGQATGGADEETSEEARRHAPALLRNRSRAVTIEDYEYLAREAAPDIAKVRCLPPRVFTEYDKRPTGVQAGDPWTYGGLNRSIGNMNVIIIPRASLDNPRPEPSGDLIREVADYLEERRTLTSRLKVIGPRYLPIGVTGQILIWERVLQNNLTTIEQVKEEALSKIKRFLHPLLGGRGGQGWEIGEDLLVSDLLEYIKLDSSIGFISSLTAAVQLPSGTTRPDLPSTGTWIQLADYEILCNGNHEGLKVDRF